MGIKIVDMAFLREYKRSKEYGLLLSEIRAENLWKNAQACANLDGEYWECGVYRGGSASLIYAAAHPKVFCLFDTFAGFPDQVDVSDAKGFAWHKWTETTGMVAAPIHQAERFLRECKGITFHPGIVPASFEGHEGARIAFAHLDMDLYRPTIAALDFIWPRLLDGGRVIVDDYKSEWEGIERAVHSKFRQDSFSKIVGACTLVKGHAIFA